MKCWAEQRETISSPAQSFCEPLTLGQVKEMLQLPERSPVDDAEDELLERMIIAARKEFEKQQGRDFVVRQWDRWYDFFPYEMELRYPLVSVDLIQYTDKDGATTTLTEGDDYFVSLPRNLVVPPYGKFWPTAVLQPSVGVFVRFTAGYSTTDPYWSNDGQGVLMGMLQMISHFYTERLPFEMGNIAAQEYPWTVTMLSESGAKPRFH